MLVEDSYGNENFRPQDDVVINRDDLYSMAWEAETNSSFLDHPKLYSDRVTLEHTSNWDAVNQHNDDSKMTQKYKINCRVIKSDTHSSQDYVNTSKIDTRITNDATTENDGTSNVRHNPNLRHEDSTASTKVNIPTSQNDEPFQDETFFRGGKYNQQPNLNPNFLDSHRY